MILANSLEGDSNHSRAESDPAQLALSSQIEMLELDTLPLCVFLLSSVFKNVFTLRRGDIVDLLSGY